MAALAPAVLDVAPAPAAIAIPAAQPINDMLQATIAPPEPPKPITHAVEEGETVRMLAARYSISPETLMAANGIRNPDLLQVGQNLVILPTDGVLYTLRRGESINKIAERFSVTPKVLNGKLRVEKENAHAFVSQAIENFSGMIESVTLSKPTREDVFIARTGHRFWEDGQ